MTTDHDNDQQDIGWERNDVDVELLRWQREMTKFRNVNLQVQGADEAGCLEELERTMDKFAMRLDAWELVSARYTRETVATTQGGDTVLTVWAMDAVLIRTDGVVPWSGLAE